MNATVATRVATRFEAKRAATRVAARFTTKRFTTKNATIIYRAPEGITWGWRSPSPPRMHLRPMDDEHRNLGTIVWLEDAGVRAFEVEGADGLPADAIDNLRSWMATNRTYIERAWVKFLKSKNMIRLRGYGIGIEVVAYPGMATQITRDIDVSICPCWVTDADVGIEDDSLVIGVGQEPREQVRILLHRIIWIGADDGSDAGTIPF